MNGQKSSMTTRIFPIIRPLKKQQSKEEAIIIPILTFSLSLPMQPMKKPNDTPMMQPIKEVNSKLGSAVPKSTFMT